jgi:hypothetical protein
MCVHFQSTWYCAPVLTHKAYTIPSYVSSRFYLHDPPGEGNVFMPHPDIPPEALEKERKLAKEEPDVNPWACILLLVITVALMGVTAEFVRTIFSYAVPTLIDATPSPQLVDGVTSLQEGNIQEE